MLTMAHQNSSPKAAFFLPNLDGGGAERIVVNLANGLNQAGVKVDLILKIKRGALLAELSPEVRVIDLNAPRMIATLPGIVRYLRQESPVVLFANLEVPNLVSLIAGLFAPRSARIFTTTHNVVSVYEPFLFGKAMERRLSRRLFPLAAGNIAVSQAAAADLAGFARLPLERIRVIYNPILTPAFYEKRSAPLDAPWLPADETPLVLAVGRLNPVKDFPTLLRAFARVRRQRPARLAILGEGAERPALEKLAAELGIAADFDLPGFQSNPFPLMQRAAALVISSQSEGLGNSAIEAMACGCPVVATDCPGGVAEILKKGEYGHLTPVGDDATMAAAILEVLDGKGRHAPSAWLEQFTLEHAVRQYLDILG
jgi:glycosyltransferase involved in cell wall biosynthesis